MPAMNAASRPVTAMPEHAVRQVLAHEQRDRVVVLVRLASVGPPRPRLNEHERRSGPG